VVLTKGTILVRAERIIVRQDAEGYQSSTATGNPVRFRQAQDPKEGRDGAWSTRALRIEIGRPQQQDRAVSKTRASTATATRSRATTSGRPAL